MGEKIMIPIGDHSRSLFRPDDRQPEDMDVTRMVEVGVDFPARLEGTFEEIQQECWKTAETHGWHDKPASLGDRLMLIVSEAAEALEEIRNGHHPSETYYIDGEKPEGFPSELADIVVRVMDLAELYGIDLSAAMREKMTYNKTRSYRHGGKAL